MNGKLRQRIGDAIAAMQVFNHHEHCWKSFSTDHQQEFDLPYLMTWGYLGGNLEAAGLRERRNFDYLSDPSLPDGSEKAWSLIAAYLPKVRNTVYYRYLLPTLRDLFQIEERDLYGDSWRAASERIRAYSRQTKGKGAELSGRMGTTCSVIDAKAGIAPALPNIVPSDHTVLNVIRLDRFIHDGRGLKLALEDHPNRDFEGWMELFEGMFRQALDDGASGFKCGLAYNRPLDFSCPPRDAAAGIFDRGILTASPVEKKTFQDYMMNRLAELCVGADVPLQIHAGMTEDIAGANPTHMTEFLYKHEELRLDLFHGGHPWSVQAGLMARNHRNVFIDGCWLHSISYQGFRQALTSWIENVPMNKIFAWGGDHTILEQSYGSLLVARELVADVLADLVEKDYFDEELALEVARRILHDNGIEFWRVEKQ
jgi:hypothetical protein